MSKIERTISFCVKWGQQQNILVTVSLLPKIPPLWFGFKRCFFYFFCPDFFFSMLLENTDPSTACESIKPPLWCFISAVCGNGGGHRGVARIVVSSTLARSPQGNIHRRILCEMKSPSIMQRKFQTIRYLKFLHHNKQWDLLVGLLFGASCWFGWRWSGGRRGERGGEGQTDLCHVARVRIPAVCHGAHVAPHLVAKNAFATTNGWTIWLGRREEKIPFGCSLVCRLERSRNCTFPSSWRQQMKQVSNWPLLPI